MESSSILSDGSSSSSVSRRYAQRANSDEEVILASNRPKRSAGRKKFRETRHPVYRGVRQRNNNKWVCEVREPNKKSRIWLGTFQTAEMAARAHDVAALALRGRSACLNFADSVWRLPQPVSTDAKDIRKAAMDAAEAFHESSLEEGVEAFNESSLEEVGGGGEGGSGSGGGCGGEVQCEERVGSGWEDDQNHHVFYLDEDVEFGMPGLLDSLAEGLLLSPPPPPAAAPSTNMGSGLSWDDDYSVSLWSYSI